MDLKDFRRSLNQNCGVKHHEKILVGFSGGCDSITLLHLLLQCKNQIFVAHCNFQLRGDESDGDEEFVINFCTKNNIPFFIKRFNTIEYADENGISIEMAARDLRYSWFNKLILEHELNWIAVGHHLDDNIETFFINLIRGTGIKGLAGMQPVVGNLIRPLLEFTRQELLSYSSENQIDFRTDTTNSECKFIRNKIRNQLIPLIESINPSFTITMRSNMNICMDVDQFVESQINHNRDSLMIEEDGMILIPISLIKEYASPKLVLFELLKEKGFNSSQIKSISESLEGDSGKQFFSDSYRLVIDRYNLILIGVESSLNDNYYIESHINFVENPLKVEIRKFEKDDGFKVSRDSKCVHIDAKLIEYPLHIRKWQHGDVFKPLGMTSFKKLSDFFIDEKFSLIEKENTWLIVNNDDIVWIVGNRLDDRYKITDKTMEIIELKIL